MKEKRRRKAILWNTASGLVNAGQSAVILIFISHHLQLNDAGIFTIGYALGNLFMTMGKYGVRNFQVTDYNEQYSFREYRNFRVLTSTLGCLIMFLYLFLQSVSGKYSPEKTLVVALICLWKMIDPIEDVYYGMYQQKDRLDVGAMCYTIRLTLSTVIFCALTFTGMSLAAISAVTLLVSLVSAVIMVILTKRGFPTKGDAFRRESVGRLLRSCFPLFIGTSLSIYVGNAPKYLIDWFSNADDVQAVFGYIMMPTFVIMMINQFIYQPFIRDLGMLWQCGRRKELVGRVLIQFAVTAAITFCVVIAGAAAGIPVLSRFYNTDLSPYKTDFIILLIGGGIYALANYITVPMTAIRAQNGVAIGYVIVSLCSVVLGKILISGAGVSGAVRLYVVLNVILAIFFAAYFFVMVRRKTER